MARLIGGIGTSHVPIIGAAYDRGQQLEPAWRPLFEGYEPIAGWLAEQRPDVLLMFYNDHVTTFFFDLYPTFSIGVDATFELADEGTGQRPLPRLKSDPAFAAYLTEWLINEEFDLAIFQDRPVDHGCHAPLPLLWPHEPDWPGAVIPIAINVLQYPLPTALRCYRLGQAVRRAIDAYPRDIKVAVVGTGGLSHQVHGERTGFNNVAWDQEFLDRLHRDPQSLARMTHAEFVRRGGAESVEQIMWLAMRGALSQEVTKLHENYYLATTTAMACVLYEEPGGRAAPAMPPAEYRNPQLMGLDDVAGTYLMDVRQSSKALTLNRFFWRMREQAHRDAFVADEEALYERSGLTEEERGLVRRRDWIGLVRYGVIFFVLEKFARVVGKTNLEVYASMRGETLEQYLSTRRVPEAR
jgi:gallate dioxygenase